MSGSPTAALHFNGRGRWPPPSDLRLLQLEAAKCSRAPFGERTAGLQGLGSLALAEAGAPTRLSTTVPGTSGRPKELRKPAGPGLERRDETRQDSETSGSCLTPSRQLERQDQLSARVGAAQSGGCRDLCLGTQELYSFVHSRCPTREHKISAREALESQDVHGNAIACLLKHRTM